MLQPFPQEHELISFFGAAPEFAENDVDTSYTEATYTTHRDGRVVIFSVSQMEYQAKIEVRGDQGPELVLELHWVEAIRFDEHPRFGTSMVIEMSDSKLNNVRFSVDPVP